MIRTVFCFLALCALAVSGTAQKQPAIRIGWINEGLSPREAAAVKDYLSQQHDFTFVPLTFSRLTAARLQKEHITHIWWLRDATGRPTAEEKNAGPLLKRFVRDGGHLVLSMEAVRLLNEWGIEKNRLEIREDSVIDEGFGRPCGFHAFGSHPVFDGMHGGAYTWKGKTDHLVRKIGFFGQHLPDTAVARVIGIGWTYITFHEDEKLLLEYRLGKGSVIAVGAYTYFSPANFNALQLRRFYDNIFNYTAGRLHGEKAAYWIFSGPQVLPWKKSFRPLAVTPATRWKLPPPTLQMERRKATDAFVDVAGRSMLVMGKERGGIAEIWSHPFMSFRDIRTGVRMKGADTVTWLNGLTPAITVSPEMLIRTYTLGGDTLREMITADFDKPVAVLHYEWSSPRIDRIWIQYATNLRMMWPYSDTASPVMRYQWSEALNAALAGDPHTGHVSLMGFSARPVERRLRPYKDFKAGEDAGLKTNVSLLEVRGIFSFDAAALKGKLNAYLVAGAEGSEKTVALYRAAMPTLNGLYRRSSEYYRQLLETELMITTPDKDFNKGYRWAAVRSDQFLQKTPGLGVSLMAGFGTTARGWNGRQQVSGRPGYAWYFGRDGEWSAMALDAVGAFEKVRQVLDLFVKYQAVNGKILHELTSSGAVHYDAADATPLFVVLASHYLRYSGDTAYIRRIWPAIKKAMDFCYSTDTDGDGLIENTNVGHGWIEGGPLFGTHTEFYLAGAWAAALDAAAGLAGQLRLPALKAQYEMDAQRVKKSIDRDFWSSSEQHFYNGKMTDGSYMKDATVLTAVPVWFNAVTDPHKARQTTRPFSGSAFSTDWGMRIIPEDNPKFNPLAYHAGMVWPLFSGYASLAEYKTGRYVSGFTHLMNNLTEYRRWALGSAEETLNGETFQPAGVCSQQCWSETMVLQPAVEGMLGLVPDALSHSLRLSPCFPWNWDSVMVSNIHSGSSLLRMRMRRSAGAYEYSFEKTGKDVLHLAFEPALPPGTHISKVLADGRVVNFRQVREEEAVKVLLAPLDITRALTITVLYEGGTGVLPLLNDPEPGAHNTGAKITGQQWEKDIYTIRIEGIPGKTYQLQLFSATPFRSAENARISATGANSYKIDIRIPEGKDKYGEVRVRLHLRHKPDRSDKGG